MGLSPTRRTLVLQVDQIKSEMMTCIIQTLCNTRTLNLLFSQYYQNLMITCRFCLKIQSFPFDQTHMKVETVSENDVISKNINIMSCFMKANCCCIIFFKNLIVK